MNQSRESSYKLLKSFRAGVTVDNGLLCKKSDFSFGSLPTDSGTVYRQLSLSLSTYKLRILSRLSGSRVSWFLETERTVKLLK